jgi:hypothetical protein
MISSERLIKVVEETGHHPMGASSASRWMKCPASVSETLELPSTTNAAAEEGTRAHELAEILFNGGQIPKGTPDDMLGHIRGYVSYVKGLVTKGSSFAIEKRLDLTSYIPEGMGTADALIYNGGLLTVVDLKYGYGEVSAVDNLQLKIYALGAYKALRANNKAVTEVKLVVYQPRTSGPAADEWSIDVHTLKNFGRTLRKAARDCLVETPKYKPSEAACRWCQAKPTCPALATHITEAVMQDFDELDGVTYQKMSHEDRLSYIVTNRRLLDKYLDDMEAEALATLSHGGSVKGLKLVRANTRKKWSEDANTTLPELLGDDAYKKSLITITEASKMLGKKRLEDLDIITKPEGALIAVAVSDKRPVVDSVIEDFSTL